MIRIEKYGEADISSIFARPEGRGGLEEAVAGIIAEVRRRGDAALLEYAERFDHARLGSLTVSPEEMQEAAAQVEPEFMAVLSRAAENIRAFHSRQVRSGFMLNERPGVVLGQKVLPIERAGLYVPGGTAAYPSTVLMAAIPARVAGCKEIVITTPPGRDGRVNPAILAAARIAGVDRVFKAGGAQAIAALAYGTESIPRVDKIVGPGNAYVAEAKRQVYGRVSIDMIAGPSEVLIVADGGADARLVAADMLAQAEHDRMAGAVLATPSEELARAVAAELERQLALLPRREIAGAAIEHNGRIIITEGIEQAIDLSNSLAPEHLELCLEEPFAWLDRVRHAGSVFLGRYCPEALGDYMAGPNHTLPTMGTARFSSPLSVDDFVKKMQYTYYTPGALGAVAGDVAMFAEREGLNAHARSVTMRMEDGE